MNKRELAKLKKWTDTLTDEQLKEEYYDAVFDTLGSQAEEMYERGYDLKTSFSEIIDKLLNWVEIGSENRWESIGEER